MREDTFYKLWERFATSNILESLPDDVEEFCDKNEITVDYFIKEFL